MKPGGDRTERSEWRELAGERTRLIPWVSAIVKQVDLAARRIVVEWGADW